MNDATRTAIAAWCEANPYTVYAHYDDTIPADAIAALLQGDGMEALDEHEIAVADNARFYADRDDDYATMCKALSIDPEDETAREVFDESFIVDTSDYMKTAARNTRLHIVAMPYLGEPGQYLSEEDQQEALFLFPHSYCPDGESERRSKQLLDVLGVVDPAEAETMYEFDTLKVIGSLDIADLIENGPPTHITFGPTDIDNLFTHNRVNGSGGLGIVRVTKEVTTPAVFRVDNGDRYGVDAVYGLIGEVWRRDLRASRVEAIAT